MPLPALEKFNMGQSAAGATSGGPQNISTNFVVGRGASGGAPPWLWIAGAAALAIYFLRRR